jgi:hypothetical protein
VTAVRDDRIAQELMMGAEDALGFFIAHPLQQVGRIYEVGKEQGYSAGVSHCENLRAATIAIGSSRRPLTLATARTIATLARLIDNRQLSLYKL